MTASQPADSQPVDVVRDVESGRLRGTAYPTHTVFYSIPYAAAPVGIGRFQAPAPVRPWLGVRAATAPGPTAPQLPRGRFGSLDISAYFDPGWRVGPDYLTVNIWSPRDVAGGAPVLVFLHGGAFVAGSSHSPMLDGSRFAQQGVVVVTVNYRLGIAGFLDIPGARPNRGLADVVAALAWVNRNVTAFGGDPARVTLAGQSAGAMLTAAAIAAPEAAGLFARAVMQSGSGRAAFSREQAAIVRDAAAATLGVAATLDGFADLTDQQLIDAVPKLTGLDLGTATVRDPLQRITPLGVVLDDQPVTTVAHAAGQPVDLLIGHNTDEGNLYLLPNGVAAATTLQQLTEAAEYADPDPDRLLSAYRRLHPTATPGRLRSIILGDAVFGAGSRAMADSHSAAGKRTYAYAFGWRSPALARQLGATHIVELPFVFDNLLPTFQSADGLLGTPAPAPLAARVHRAWVDFVTFGTPGWPEYRPDRRTTQLINDEWAVVDDPFAAERDAWTHTHHTRTGNTL
ncbi:carboxylesterase/lipase family protein [Nocardia sp. CA-119907]|uniref:carboxylesterase/lipase family protein n=1 Tax=Nocardia sp. CA-119907 TaxID=3239973 RepID=UPI003D984A99